MRRMANKKTTADDTLSTGRIGCSSSVNCITVSLAYACRPVKGVLTQKAKASDQTRARMPCSLLMNYRNAIRHGNRACRDTKANFRDRAAFRGRCWYGQDWLIGLGVKNAPHMLSKRWRCLSVGGECTFLFLLAAGMSQSSLSLLLLARAGGSSLLSSSA